MQEIDELLTILSRERQVYEKIKAGQNAKKASLVERNQKGLDESVTNIERLCWHLEGLEKERQEAVRNLARSLGMDDREEDEMTVSVLAGQIGGQEGQSLLEVSENLSSLLDEVQDLNQENAYIVGRSLEFVSDILQSLLAEINETNIAYTNQGLAASGLITPGFINQRA